MKKCFAKVASAVLTCAMLVMSGSAVLADPVTEITAPNGVTYTLGDDGLYKYVYGDTTYIYVDQETVEKCNNALPSYEKNASYYYVNFYVAENITVTESAETPYGCRSNFDMAGHEITYLPDDEDIDKPMLYVTGGNNNAEFKGASDSRGTIRSPKGASIMEIEGISGYSSHVYLYYMDVIGFESPAGKTGYSAIEMGFNSNFNLYSESKISNFCADKGGAIYAPDENAYIFISSGSIENCYAREGGAIYSEGSFVVGTVATISGNTASERGGGVCLTGPGTSLTINDMGTLNITGNTCNGSSDIDQGGGGMYFSKERTSSSVSEGKSLLICGELNVNNNTSATQTKKNLYLRYTGSEFNTLNLTGIYFYEPGTYKPNTGISCGTVTDGTVVASYTSYRYEDDQGELSKYYYYDDPGYCIVPAEIDAGSQMYKLKVVSSTASGEPAELQGFSVALTDGTSIGVKYYVYLPESEDIGSASNKIWRAEIGPSAGYSLFARGSDSKMVDIDGFERDGSFITFTYYIDSTDMAVPLDFTLYKNGSKVLSYSGFSVRSYADAITSHMYDYSTSVQRRIATLVTYGGAAQTYFGFMADDLASKNLPAKVFNGYSMKPSSSTVSTLKNNASSLHITDIGNQLSFYGGTITFSSMPAIKFYFQMEDGISVDDIRVVDDNSGEEYAVHAVPGTKYFYIKYDCPISELEQTRFITIEVDGMDSLFFKPSGYWYLFRIIDGNFSSEMKALAQATFEFSYWFNHYS